MANNAIETVMGAVVLAVAGGFLYFAYSNGNVKHIDGYNVTADFSNITGISNGSDVRIGGIKVGVVEKLDLDPKTYQAEATLRVRDDIKLPKDTSAAVRSSGLLGAQFIALQIGNDEQMLENDGHIGYTESSVNLEEMLGKFIFSVAESKKDAKPAASDTPEKM
ncbi:MAG: outer membrane lipid asymmetry maintenance protein MlaD [Rhodospirillales bacterium 12-54-5]|nr:MAG: outer membrane lipid asymmetry maintenance protein MlaD [Rhodospirillales bacterium 12-54-5]